MAKLPNAGSATIDPRKIGGYLLSDHHKTGGPKSRFLKLFGFDPERPGELRAALLDHAQEHPVGAIIPAEHGIKYEVNGPMSSPDGRVPKVRTVWIIHHDETDPRFVTLKPLRR